MIKTQTDYLNTLATGDLFTLPGESTIYRCERRYSETGWTTVFYTVPSAPGVGEWSYTRPGLSTIQRVI